MAAKCSTAPAFVWNWVIEALARFEQADISTLIGLVKLAPAISGDAGNNARELVSLRILESLFDHGNEAIVDPDSAQNDKISFDASERCEDVLHKILHETPGHMAKLEKEKWNVGPFLTHKRSSLAKCSLKKLKETILESNHPLLASLKERSNLITTNVSKDTTPGINNIEHTLANDDLALNPKKDKNKFHENVVQEANQVDKSTQDKTTDQPRNNEERETIIEHLLEESRDRHETITDIATKKDTFLNSRFTCKQDSSYMTELSEMDLCMKCNEGGRLLVCSSESCPLRVHESCLGSSVIFDENNYFFCPFCAYSRAISKYLEAKKKASIARKNLQAFSSLERISNESSKKLNDLEKNITQVFPETAVDSVNCTSNEDSVLPDPIVQVVNDDDIRVEGTELPRNPIPEPSTPKQKCKKKESQRSTESSCSRRLRKRKAQYISPPLPALRRKILQWTKSEEDVLKEGVEKYANGNNKGIPWKEILDFGRNVFNNGRTAIDLKDKWRNICKGTPDA